MKQYGKKAEVVNELGMTEVEVKLLSIIYEYIKTRGGSPPLRWLCRRMGWRSVNATTWYLTSLARKGLLSWRDGEVGGRGREIFLPGLRIMVGFSEDITGRLLQSALKGNTGRPAVSEHNKRNLA